MQFKLMEQSVEQPEALEQRGNNTAASALTRAMAATEEIAPPVLEASYEAGQNIQVPNASPSHVTTTIVNMQSATTTTQTGGNAVAADAIIDLCNASPTPNPSTSNSAAAIIALDSSVDEVDEEEESSSGADDVAAATGTSNTTIECPICLQTCIHPARLPCGHIFCFLCVKGVAYKNRRCAMCRREIPPEFLDHPDLVNGIDDICVTKSTEDGYQWFYEGRNGGWWAYDARTTKDIESTYQTRMLSTDIVDLEDGCQYEILICGAMYTIDFCEMVQYPIENPTRWWQYDDRTSQDIEEAFKKGEKSCIILVAGYVYVVDLEAMVQQRQNEPVRCRRVKRDLATIPKKGVAGLRIEGNTVITDSNFASQVQQQQQRNIIIGISAANTPLDPTSDFSPPLNFYSLRHPTNASDFITTIAATDAAIRIASDIIGSTLAHADELSRSTGGGGVGLTGEQNINDTQHITQQQLIGDNTGNYSGNYRPLLSSGSIVSGTPTSSSEQRLGNLPALVTHGSRELLDAAEDLLDATQNVISEADQQTIDLFEQTLNDFHALTLRNIIDSDSDDEANGDGGGGDVDGRYAQRHIRF